MRRRLLGGLALAALSLAAAGAALAAEGRQRPFTEVSREAGIDWVHHPAIFDDKLSHIMSWMNRIHAGCAVADFDGDGDDDIYFLDSLAGEPNVLYRNDGDFRFVEVGREVGVADLNAVGQASMDAIFVDVDNDRDQDLVVAAYGHSRLLLNRGGHFEEVTDRAGVGQQGNAAAVVALDVDNDGWLDLMVGHYFGDVDLWNIPHPKILQTNFETARNGGPNRFYRNRGDGTFEEKAQELGLDDTGWTLALGTGDLDDDGDVDLYLANDFGPDRVYRNDGGKLVDVTEQATGAPDRSAGMNVDVGDYDNDGDLDVYVTNILNQMLPQGNMLWQNQGEMRFVDVAVPTGSIDGGWGWGAKFFDFDHDGDLDLYTVNGYVSDGPVDIFRRGSQLNRGNVSDIRGWPDMRGLSLSGYETSRLFRNDGLNFTDIARFAGVGSQADGRGVAVSDFDRDGDPDLLVSNSGSAPELYRNEVGHDRPWLQVELVGSESNADAIGARVTVVAGGERQVREVSGGNGYSAQSSKVLHFGLAGAESVDQLEVRWPSGKRQLFRDLPARQRLYLVE